MIEKSDPADEQSCFINSSAGKMTLINRDDDSVIMRHSTCRVAFSTVDPVCPTTFCYVALVKDTDMALCHVFRSKTAKQAYELTFTCAQAFDYNYRAYVAKTSASLDSSLLEPTIEPAAVQEHIASLVNAIDEADAAEGTEEEEDMRAGAGYMEISAMIYSAAASGLEEFMESCEAEVKAFAPGSPGMTASTPPSKSIGSRLGIQDEYIDILPTSRETYHGSAVFTVPASPMASSGYMTVMPQTPGQNATSGYMTVMPQTPRGYMDISDSLNTSLHF